MKKLLAICLSVFLLCAAIPFSFAAADEVATVVVSDAEGKAGDEVSVTVSIKNNPGLVSAKVRLDYDTSAVELVDKAAGEFPGSGYSWGAMGKEFFVINFCDPIAEADHTYELLATLTFKIKEDAPTGVYPFTMTCDYEGDFYNLAWDVLEFEEQVGAITVSEERRHIYSADCDPICNVCGYYRSGNKEPEVDGTTPTVVVSSAAGRSGDEVTVSVKIKNNPGLVAAKVKLDYDTNVVELIDKAAGEFPGSGYSWGQLGKEFFVINFCDAIAYEDYTCELLATLTFKIKDDAPTGVYPFTMTCDYEGDFYNLAWDVLEFDERVGVVAVNHSLLSPHTYDHACDAGCNACGDIRVVPGHAYDNACDTDCNHCGAIREVPDHIYDHRYDESCNVCGAVRVIVIVFGDANEDYKVNNRDLGLLQQYLNDWDVCIDMIASDVNSSKRINNRDLGLLQQYLNDWDVVLG